MNVNIKREERERFEMRGIKTLNKTLKIMRGKPGRIIFCSDYKRGRNYIERYIKKYYGKNAPTVGVNDTFGYFTEDQRKWFKIILVNKDTEMYVEADLKKQRDEYNSSFCS